MNIVLDLDGTLIYSLPLSGADITAVNPANGLEIPYKLAHGALEFIRALFHLPGTRLSVFSAGEKARNMILVKKIMSLSGCYPPKYHLISRLFSNYPQILSKQDLDTNNAKDLTKLSYRSFQFLWPYNIQLEQTKINLERTIMVDDNYTTPISQYNNILKIFNGLGYGSSLEFEVQIENKVTERILNTNTNTIPNNITNVNNHDNISNSNIFHINNNLIRALGLILLLREDCLCNGSTPRVALNTLQWEKCSEAKGEGEGVGVETGLITGIEICNAITQSTVSSSVTQSPVSPAS
eukprot:gene11306-23660_t